MLDIVTREPEAGNHVWLANKHGFAYTFQNGLGCLVFLVGITDEFHKCVQNEQSGWLNQNRVVQRELLPQHTRFKLYILNCLFQITMSSCLWG